MTRPIMPKAFLDVAKEYERTAHKLRWFAWHCRETQNARYYSREATIAENKAKRLRERYDSKVAK